MMLVSDTKTTDTIGNRESRRVKSQAEVNYIEIKYVKVISLYSAVTISAPFVFCQ